MLFSKIQILLAQGEKDRQHRLPAGATNNDV